MESNKKISRRNILKTGAAVLAAGTVRAESVWATPKAPGEVRVLFLIGDYWHNPVMQETHWRRVLGPTGWRLLFAQSSQFVTPASLSEADLFVVCRYAGPDSLGWAPDRVIEDRPESSPFMTDAQQDAIVENVKKGMGLISVHCSIWNPERTKYMDLLGVEKPIMHTKVQPAHIHELNQNHPITKGIGEFDTGDDEIFNADLKPGQSTLLFKTSGEEQKINANGGWCREEGKGRVVALLPGHIPTPYMKKAYREIMWRSAYWAMKKDIPPFTHIKEDGY
jgi:type 1 glutamine amidotransferase